MARISAGWRFLTFLTNHSTLFSNEGHVTLVKACCDWSNLEPGFKNPEILSISLDHNELFYGNESEQIDVLKYNHNFLLSLLHELFLRL